MKKKFKSFIALAMSAAMLVSGAAVASAAEVAEPAPAAETSVSQEITISPRATDTIVWKYRIKDGVMQKRRWNATKQVWVDPYWINVT